MTAGLYAITCEQGNLFVFDGEFFDDEEASDPHDFTAHDGILIVRKRRSPDADEITRCIDDGRITFPDPLLGQVHIEIEADDTASFPEGCFYYWLSFWPQGVPEDAERWLEGEFEILAGGGGIG